MIMKYPLYLERHENSKVCPNSVEIPKIYFQTSLIFFYIFAYRYICIYACFEEHRYNFWCLTWQNSNFRIPVNYLLFVCSLFRFPCWRSLDLWNSFGILIFGIPFPGMICRHLNFATFRPQEIFCDFWLYLPPIILCINFGVVIIQTITKWEANFVWETVYVSSDFGFTEDIEVCRRIK